MLKAIKSNTQRQQDASSKVRSLSSALDGDVHTSNPGSGGGVPEEEEGMGKCMTTVEVDAVCSPPVW